MQILINKVVYGSDFAAMLTGKYPMNCDTLAEVKDYLRTEGIYIGDGSELINIPGELAKSSSEDKNFVFVEFSKEEDYTQHEVRLMTIQKRYLSRVKKFIAEHLEEEGE